MLNSSFYLDIKKIHIAHEFILDRSHRCEYPHGRGLYGLVYALSGKAEYRFFGGKHITVNKGDVLFLSPSAAYSILTDSDFHHYTVNFELHQKNSCLGILNAPFTLFSEKTSDIIAHDFKKLAEAWSRKKDGYEMRAVGRLYGLLSELYYNCIEEKNDTRLLPAKEYIEANFSLPITLSSLARLCNMSVTNFRREWKKQYGTSPLEHRDSVLLSYANEYLGCGYYTVSEVAERCGFDDVSYFVRFFKRKTGTTPGAVKKLFLGI